MEDKQLVYFKDLGIIDYKAAWDYQEELVKENVSVKIEAREQVQTTGNSQLTTHNSQFTTHNSQLTTHNPPLPTKNHLLFCEHPPVYTLGKSGSMKNVLLSEQQMDEKEIEFFKTNRGGDITFHGLQQVVGYPILDLEKFYTDIAAI
jgi:lipoyl(octanoyl) transferase